MKPHGLVTLFVLLLLTGKICLILINVQISNLVNVLLWNSISYSMCVQEAKVQCFIVEQYYIYSVCPSGQGPMFYCGTVPRIFYLSKRLGSNVLLWNSTTYILSVQAAMVQCFIVEQYHLYYVCPSDQGPMFYCRTVPPILCLSKQLGSNVLLWNSTILSVQAARVQCFQRVLPTFVMSNSFHSKLYMSSQTIIVYLNRTCRRQTLDQLGCLE